MKALLGRFASDRSGSALVFGPPFLLLTLGTMGLAVDGGNFYYTKLKLQKIADAAAAGAVFSLPDTTGTASTALDLAGRNSPAAFGTVSRSADVQTGSWDPSAKTFKAGGSNSNAVKVSTHRNAAYGNPVYTFAAKLFGLSSVDINATSVAALYGSDKCLFVLNGSAAGAYTESGSASVSATCGIQVNSTAAGAGNMTGSGTTAAPVCVTGSVKGGGWSPTPKTGSSACPTIGDPLAALAERPSPSTCSISSGCITGSVNLSGTVTLSPGFYYLKNANVTCSAGAVVNGSGVQIYLDETSTLNLSGSGSVNLSGSTALDGIVIRVSRANTGNAVTLGGSGALSLNGTVYAPAATVSFGGSATTTGKTGSVIADKVTFSGSSTFAINSFGSTAVNAPSLIRHSALVE